MKVKRVLCIAEFAVEDLITVWFLDPTGFPPPQTEGKSNVSRSSLPMGGCNVEKKMNWKIKEFTVRAKSMRKELALLVKQSSVSTSDLP